MANVILVHRRLEARPILQACGNGASEMVSNVTASVVGYHYGAGNHGELKNLLKKSILLMGGIGCGMVAAAQLLAPPLSRVFVGYDPDLYAMTVRALRIATSAFVVLGFNVFAFAVSVLFLVFQRKKYHY